MDKEDNMPNGNYDMHDLKGDMKFVKETLETFKACLFGANNKHNDLGLVGDVDKNTKFREAITKWLTTLSIAVILMIIERILSYIIM